MHIAPVVILAGKTIGDYLFGARIPTKEEGPFYMAMGVLLMVSGFVNTLLIRPKETMKENAKIWIGWHHLQLLMSLMVLTPLLSTVVSDKATVLKVRFYFVTFLLISSPFMRYYREYHSE